MSATATCTVTDTEAGLRRRPAPPSIHLPMETRAFGRPVIDEATGWSTLDTRVAGARVERWREVKDAVSTWSEGVVRSSGSTRTREYYTQLQQRIETLSAADQLVPQAAEPGSPPFWIRLSFGANCGVLAAKVLVAVQTGAFVVYASALDSVLDLAAGAILALTSRLMEADDTHRAFPSGKQRMESCSVLAFSMVMATCYAYVIKDSVVGLFSSHEVAFSYYVLALMMATVFVKSVLYVLCSRAAARTTFPCPALEAQADDHWNDCLTNSLSAVGLTVASRWFAEQVGGPQLAWVDPVTAVLFSSYVVRTWLLTAKETACSLVGAAAPAELVGKITYLSATHCEEVVAVDTVKCFSAGSRYIAEVDVVLPPDMPLRTAHDIGEALQVRIEAIPEVERCYVHLDWETDHKPEHKPL